MSKTTIDLNQSLVEKIKMGDHKAIRELYKLAFPACAAFIKNNRGTPNDAEDFFQESLVVVYRNLHKEGFELKCAISTYIYSVMRNLWMNELRKRSKSGLQLVMDEPDKEFILVQQDELEEKRAIEKKHELISELLQTFKEDCREVLMAFYFKKQSLREIAAAKGFTEQYAKKKRYTCMNAFKKLVRERMGGEGGSF